MHWRSWKTLMVAEMNFRKLNAANLVEKVAEGKSTIKEKKSGSPPKSFCIPIDNGSVMEILC